MEQIQRPANVSVPRSVRFRIDVNRALASGKKEDMVWVINEYGLTIPKNLSNEDMRRQLTSATGAGPAAQMPIAAGDAPITGGAK